MPLLPFHYPGILAVSRDEELVQVRRLELEIVGWQVGSWQVGSWQVYRNPQIQVHFYTVVSLRSRREVQGPDLARKGWK